MTVFILALLFMLLILLQRTIYRHYWANKLSIELSFSHEERHEGGSVELVSTLINRKALPLPWLTLRYSASGRLTFASEKTLPSDETRFYSDLFSVGSKERLVRRHTMICHHRGFYRITSCELIAGDLFLTARMNGRQSVNAEVMVFPRLIPRPELGWILNRIGGNVEVRSFIHFDPLVFRGIRQYAASDDVRFVNWKATAKTGDLMVNTYNATTSGSICLLLNAEPSGGYSDSEILEESIRLCASIADYFSAQGVAVSVRSNGCDAITGAPCAVLPGSGQSHTLSILRALARIDLSQPRQPMPELLSAADDPESLYVLLSGNTGDAMISAFFDLLEQRRDTLWLWPAMPDARRKLPNVPSILRWEVTEHALAPNESA